MTRPIAYSLNDLLLAIGRFLRDATQVKVTQQSVDPKQFIDTRLAVGSDNRYKGSELWVWDMPADATGRNPFLVTASSGSSGTLTLSEGVGPTAFPVGTQAVLQNIGGKGNPHELREWALQMALAQDDVQAPATVTITAPDSTTFWNAIPAGLRSIAEVTLIDPDGLTQPLGPGVWRDAIDLVGRRIYLPFFLDTGWTFALTGRQDLLWPWATTPVDYTAQVQVDPARVVKEAVNWLYLGNMSSRGQDIAANLYNDRLRTTRDHPWPNEVFLP